MKHLLFLFATLVALLTLVASSSCSKDNKSKDSDTETQDETIAKATVWLSNVKKLDNYTIGATVNASGVKPSDIKEMKVEVYGSSYYGIIGTASLNNPKVTFFNAVVYLDKNLVSTLKSKGLKKVSIQGFVTTSSGTYHNTDGTHFVSL